MRGDHHPGRIPERAAVIVRHGLNLVALFARTAVPFIPFTAEKIAATAGEPFPAPWPSADARVELARVEPGRRVAAGDVLFKKVEDADVAAWTERFGGADV